MIRLFVLLLLIFFVPQPSLAQDEQGAQEKSFFSRFLFSQEEVGKLKKALAGGFKKAPEPQKPLGGEGEDESEDVDTSPRVISLAGLVYTGPQEWTFWLNGRQITPADVPEEVQGLYVTKYYIDFRWLDKRTNQLYPIRLRPHQSFHLDTKVFFTGTSAVSVDRSVE